MSDPTPYAIPEPLKSLSKPLKNATKPTLKLQDLNKSDSTPYAIPQPLKSLSKPLKDALKTTVNPQILQTPQSPISSIFILNPSNVKQLFHTNPLIKKTIKNMGVAHKFIITNTKPALPKITILKTFINQATYAIIPMNITSPNGNSIEFYCRGSESAILKLCGTDHLMLTCMLKKQRVQVPITLVLGSNPPEELNVRERILEIIKPRVTASPVTVDLSHCDTIVGMCRKIYFDISNPLTLNYVINTIRSLNPKVLILSHNNIHSVTRWKRPIDFEIIDLSYNQITSLDNLVPIQRLELKELNLSGNPVCEELNYLQQIQVLFPKVKVIDSKPMPTEQIVYKDNYMPTSAAAEYLVDQFMEHYFNLYDNPKRRRYLQEIYHRDALFTLSSYIVDEDGLSPASQRYKHHAHNLLQTKSPTDFSVGPAEIIRKICYLPQIEHDPRSFSVEILHYDENKSVMFIIHGIFRETASMTFPVMYSFTRTFMLLAGEGGEFQIINDLLYVSNRRIKNLPAIKSFKEMFQYKDLVEITKKIPVAVSKEEKDGFLVIFIELTSLYVGEATRYLENCKWNMREALETFIHEYRFDKIDSTRFMSDEIKRVVYTEFLTIHPGINKQKQGKILEKLKTLQEEGFFKKPNGISRQGWRRHINKLKQTLRKTV